MTIPVNNDPLQSASEPQVVKPVIKIAATYVRIASLYERPSEYEQLQEIREFAVQYDFLVDDVYTDYGSGLVKPARKGLDALLLAAAVKRKYQYIIMTDYTRMFEDVELLHKYQDFLWRHSRVDLIFLDEVRWLLE